MPVTLEAIKEAQSKLGEMIATFEKQAACKYSVASATIELAPGERYAGLMLGEDGKQDYHLILLPGEAESASWEDACKWADERDAALPTRREQSLLFANLKGEFESAWYWSGERHEENSGWAWGQSFGYGCQDYDIQYGEFRARAVRRFIPSII